MCLVHGISSRRCVDNNQAIRTTEAPIIPDGTPCARKIEKVEEEEEVGCHWWLLLRSLIGRFIFRMEGKLLKRTIDGGAVALGEIFHLPQGDWHTVYHHVDGICDGLSEICINTDRDGKMTSVWSVCFGWRKNDKNQITDINDCVWALNCCEYDFNTWWCGKVVSGRNRLMHFLSIWKS